MFFPEPFISSDPFDKGNFLALYNYKIDKKNIPKTLYIQACLASIFLAWPSYIPPRASLSLKYSSLSLWHSSLKPQIVFADSISFFPKTSLLFPESQIFFPESLICFLKPMIFPPKTNFLPQWLCTCEKTGKELNDITQNWQTLPQILKIWKLFPDDYPGIM